MRFSVAREACHDFTGNALYAVLRVSLCAVTESADPTRSEGEMRGRAAGRLQESRRRNCHFGLNSVRVGFDVLAFFLDAAGIRGLSGRGFNK
jgi:hypothetical protein